MKGRHTQFKNDMHLLDTACGVYWWTKRCYQNNDESAILNQGWNAYAVFQNSNSCTTSKWLFWNFSILRFLVAYLTKLVWKLNFPSNFDLIQKKNHQKQIVFYHLKAHLSSEVWVHKCVKRSKRPRHHKNYFPKPSSISQKSYIT